MRELTPGSYFSNRFQIERKAQTGGMGHVYRARDLVDNRVVALKVLRQEADSAIVDRFLQEARTLSELHHPGIVEYVVHGLSQEGEPFLAMEWLEGEDLGHRLARQPLTVDEVMQLLHHVADALSVAHENNVFHRDLKPSNLFLRDRSVDGVTLIDFGLARRTFGGRDLTQTGVVVGTPEYMAPEQARGDRQIGPAADIFSLGCVIFECLTGSPPFVHEHVAAVLAMILFEEPPLLSKARPDLPPALGQLVAKMLVKSPTARIPNATALKAELAQLGNISGPATTRQRSSSGLGKQTAIDGEQVLVSVVIAQSDVAISDPRVTVDSSSAEAYRQQAISIRDELLPMGVAVDCMADGSLIATLSRQGAPTEQAIQAVRAALIIKERYPNYLVALATGRAVLEEGSVFGEVLSRLGTILGRVRAQKELPENGVVLDETTSRLVQDHFAQHPLVTGLTTVSQRTSGTIDSARVLLGKSTQCVGRERELALLEASLATCTENENASVVLVTAPAGVGKSRLIHEFLRRLAVTQASVFQLSGRGDPMSIGTSYGLIAKALSRFLNVHDTTTSEQFCDAVAKYAAGEDHTHVAEFLGELCGVSFPPSVMLRAARLDPRIMADQITQSFITFLLWLSQQRTVLLMLEDLHWGDPLTCKLIDQALRELAERPLMVLANARPEVEDLFPKLWSERARQDIRLGPLPKKACERLLQQVLGKNQPQSVIGRIVEQSAGNALFLEELVRAVAEGRGDELPDTVFAMLHARLMRLPAEARRVLRAASVFGETFWEGGVRRLLGKDRGSDQISDWLQILCESETLARHRESRFQNETEFGFRHGLLREAAYEMLPADDRKTAHFLAGCFLESAGERDEVVLAEHFERSGDMPRAVNHFLRAAENAFKANNLEGVLRCAERGLACGADREARGSFLSLQCSARFWRNELESALRAGCDAIGLLSEESLHWLRAISISTACAAALGRTSLASELSAQFGSIVPSDEIIGSYVESNSILLAMQGMIGDRRMAEVYLHQVQRTGESLAQNDPYIRAWMNYGIGRHNHALLPKPYKAIQCFRTAASTFRLIGDRRMTVVALGDLAYAVARAGAAAEAETYLREALSIAQRLDEPITTVWGQLFLGLVLAEKHDSQAQKEAEQTALSVLKSIGETSYYAAFAFAALAAYQLAAQNVTQAEQFARQALTILKPLRSSAPLGYIALARVLLTSDRVQEAVSVLEEGIALIDALDGCGGSELPLRLLFVDALHTIGDPREEQARHQLLLQLQKREEDIPDPAVRASYRERHAAHNARRLLF